MDVSPRRVSGRRSTVVLISTIVAVAISLSSSGVFASTPSAQAAPTRTISGTVTLPEGAPAAWMRGVRVRPQAPFFYPVAVRPDLTTGEYSFPGLEPGSYRVEFFNNSVPTDFDATRPSLLAPEYYDNATDFASATVVDVTNGDAAGVDAALELGASMIGVIDASSLLSIPFTNVVVTLTDVLGKSVVTHQASVQDGKIHIRFLNVRSGTYRVAVSTYIYDPALGSVPPLTAQYLQFGDDSTLTVKPGDRLDSLRFATRSIDAEISGTGGAAGVSSSEEWFVGATQLYEHVGEDWLPVPGGSVSIRQETVAPFSFSVPAGAYKVAFESQPPASDIADEWWEGASSLESAASITLTPGQHQTGVTGGLVPAGSPLADRVAGDDRFETSAAVSAAAFAPGVPVAYVANGWKFPDALSGAAAAGTLAGPVLLTDQESVPGIVADELARLKPKKVVILGSEASVGEGVVDTVALYTDSVERTAGADRFGTSAAVSAATFSPGVPVAYLANGWKFPDALSGAAAAGTLGGPVLLTDGQSLPGAVAAELARLKPAKIVLLGSSDSVGDAVRSAARKYTSTVARLSGSDRFETSAAVSAASFAPGVPVVYLANGWKFPDALSGAAAAGVLGGPVLLTNTDALPASIAAELARLDPERIVVLGDGASVADAARLAARVAAG